MIQSLLNLIPVSWRTTVCGVLGLVAYIAAQLSFLLSPDKQGQFEELMHGLSTLCLTAGLMVARDRGVSTEQERSKEPAKVVS